MQKEYLDIGNKDIENGNYLLAVFKLETYGEITLEDAATELAAESSTGSNLKVSTATNFSQSLDAIVYDVDEKNHLVRLAYPWRMFDRGGNIQNIATFLAGNIYGMSELKACKLLDIHFPTEMMTQYDGPSYTLFDMRKYLEVFDRPILGTIIKPKIGLTSNEYAELCYDFWAGGGDFVKNDEPQADQDFSPFDRMVDSVAEAMDKAQQETGHTKVHSFNISAADFDTMRKRADYIVEKMQPGSYSFLVDGITAGWTAVQSIRRAYPGVYLHFHRAGHGAFTRVENPFGFTVPVMTKFARLAGASGIHTGTAGVGKMAGNPEEDVTAAKHALNLVSQGDYFTQVWSKVPPADTDIQKAINLENKQWLEGPRAMAEARKNITEFQLLEDWRVIQPTNPIISGGLNPVLLPAFIDTFGSIDFIVTMGGGVHSHPMGTRAGATAVLQAYDAWKNRVSLENYAKGNPELESAIEFFNKKGTQATRVENTAYK